MKKNLYYDETLKKTQKELHNKVMEQDHTLDWC
jgi:hypothetical protein